MQKPSLIFTMVLGSAIGLAGGCARESMRTSTSTPPTVPSTTTQTSGTASREQTATTGANTLTGCLMKESASGKYVLTDETGKKTTVTGTGLEKHSNNHKVTLTGTITRDGGFRVTKIEHISANCSAPNQ